MNLLMLAEVSPARVIGGAERAIREQASGLRRLGHTVTVICRKPSDKDPDEVVWDRVVEYRYPVHRGTALTFVTSSILNAARSVARTARRSRIDGILVHQALSGLGPIMLQRNVLGQRVYVCHSLAHEEYLTRTPRPESPGLRASRIVQAWYRRIVERWVLNACPRIVVLSEFMRHRVMQYHKIPSSRIRVIPGGADTNRFVPAEDRDLERRLLGIEPATISLFTVRNLVPRMGLENLVDAMKPVAEKYPQVRLVIGGAGPLREKIEAVIARNGLMEHVTLIGFIDEDALVRRYQAADLVLMPTAMLEGFGLVTVEALACGTPVLGTPVAATPEILNRVDPSLVTTSAEARDLTRGLFEQVERMLNAPDGWKTLRARCRSVALNRHNWDTHCERLYRALFPCRECP